MQVHHTFTKIFNAGTLQNVLSLEAKAHLQKTKQKQCGTNLTLSGLLISIVPQPLRSEVSPSYRFPECNHHH